MNTPDLRLSGALACALAEHGYHTLTPVQTAVANASPASTDLVVSAPTGSGKTLAIAIAIAQHLEQPCDSRNCIIVAPTRELARQIHSDLSRVFTFGSVRTMCFTGGVPVKKDLEALASGYDLVVGTPGRLCDHIRHGNIRSQNCVALVFDEVDEILNQGFRQELDYIISQTPDSCRRLMFSATLPGAAAKTAQQYIRSGPRIDIGPDNNQTAGTVEFHSMQVSSGEIRHTVANLLLLRPPVAAFVFCQTRAAVADIYKNLLRHGHYVVCLTGDMSQTDRTSAIAALKSHRARVCVATDLAARGLDIPGLCTVIHAGPPRDVTTFRHRNGRTGRNGKPGRVITIIEPGQRRKADKLARLSGICPVWSDPPDPTALNTNEHSEIVTELSRQRPATDQDSELASTLLSEFDAEQLALALARIWRSRRPMTDSSGTGPIQWLEFDTGDKTSSDVGAILTQICAFGGVDRSSIGRIHVGNGTTRFEVPRSIVHRFLAGNIAGTSALRMRYIGGR